MDFTFPRPDIEIVNAFDGLAPSFPSSSAISSSSLQMLPCDVFINHRGPDVKHRLARDIYNALHDMGLKVFLDSEDLYFGDHFPQALQHAISTASLHIAIFSPTYVQSPWCLAELSFMLNSGKPIIPIFYHVQSDDLRHLVHGKGIFVASFLEHEDKGRYNIEKLNEWKVALHNVSFYKGEKVNTDEEERRVLKNIVNRVLEVMKIVPLEVATHPVGLEEVVAEFEIVTSKRKTHSDVQILGIWGMGGSGKTTLAKELYNQKSLYMKHRSFLFDVRNAANKNELHKMQIQLLNDLECKFNEKKLNNVEQGKKIISNYLRSVPVFIIIDDADHRDQLEALLPANASLASGSLIIVTTRDKEVLKFWTTSCIYEMKSMNRFHAKQLFCSHAFLQPVPPSGYEDLVEKFISVSNGLPLSLKVFGAQLYGCYSKDLWEEVLHKISRLLPNDIINRLRVSYDALDREEKQMFLDVACFFIGQDKMTAIAVWEEAGWCGQWGWKRLVSKCLVDIDNKNKIIMHDHLRDLGREIAKTLSPHRLWSPDQFRNIDNQEEIRGMILKAATNDVHKFLGSLLNTSINLFGFRITRRPFPRRLKVFVVGSNCTNYLHIVKSSTELAWLSYTGISHKNLPSLMPLKSLRVLELHDCCNIVGLWKDEVDAPMQLRVLIISSCQKLQGIPKSIGNLKSLKNISLSRCNVESLPKAFCHLQSLEQLELQYCGRLSSLPRCFGHLKNLQHLDLSYCSQLRVLPNSCKQLMLLHHLDLQGCERLTLHSDMLEYMTKLQYLNLDGCTLLEELPHHITNQALLSELYLKNTRLRELPANIGELTKLKLLEICPYQGFFQMQSLPDSMGHLTLLERLVLKNLKVQSLPDSMGNLTLLRRLVLENLKVRSLPRSLKLLTNLQLLKIEKCPIRELDFRYGPFTCLLRNLKGILLRSTKVSKISISNDCCPALKFIELSLNDHLTEVDTLPTSVEALSVSFCRLLRSISGIADLANLQELNIIKCPELEMIQGLQHCTSLEDLRIEGECWEASGVDSWEQIQRLRRVILIANKRPVVERCIQMIQKWPDDIVICTKAVARAGLLLDSSAFPSNISIIHTISNQEFNCSLFNHSLSGNAMLLCLIINCGFPGMRLEIMRGNLTIFSGEMEEGKWTWIGLFTQNSTFLTTPEILIEAVMGDERNCKVDKGMVVRGEEESVIKSFHYLFALLGS